MSLVKEWGQQYDSGTESSLARKRIKRAGNVGYSECWMERIFLAIGREKRDETTLSHAEQIHTPDDYVGFHIS